MILLILLWYRIFPIMGTKQKLKTYWAKNPSLEYGNKASFSQFSEPRMCCDCFHPLMSPVYPVFCFSHTHVCTDVHLPINSQLTRRGSPEIENSNGSVPIRPLFKPQMASTSFSAAPVFLCSRRGLSRSALTPSHFSTRTLSRRGSSLRTRICSKLGEKSALQHRKLGDSDLVISEITLGTVRNLCSFPLLVFPTQTQRSSFCLGIEL